MALIPGTLRLGQVATTPPAPPVGYIIFYTKTDNVIYFQDSNGVETPVGTASGITSLIGDVTGTGPGAAAVTVVQVGGKTASEIAAVVNDVQAATSSNTLSAIVKRDSLGNFAANVITAALNGTATGNVNKTGDTMTGPLNINSGASNALIVDTDVLVVDAALNRIGVNKVNPTEALDVVGNGKFSGTVSSSNISGSNTGDVTVTDTANIDLTLIGQNLSADLINTGVTSGTYGTVTKVSQITVDQKGRLTNALEVTIAIPSSQITDFTEAVQDVLGSTFQDTNTIDITYNDSLNTITADVKISDSTITSDTNGIKVGTVTDSNIASGVSATKIGSGVVSNTEFSYLDGATSNLQNQIDNKQPLDSTLTSLAGFNSNGLMTQTAPDTFTSRTITSGTGINVVDGDGIAGNPTINLTNVGTSGTYGSSSQVPVVTTDAQGRVTNVTNTNIDITASQINNFNEAAQDSVGNILTDTSSIDFTYNDGLNTITADVKPAGVDHDQLLNYVANKHIDHSAVNVSAGAGLTGGGNITSSVTISMPPVGSAGIYGSASSIPVITTDLQGRVSNVTNTSVNITSSQVSDFNEASQDSVGGILTDTATIDFTYDDSLNTITADVKNNSITDSKLTTGINANKISSGVVSNTEFDYLDGVTSGIQGQLDNKQPLDSTLTSLAGYNSNGLLTQTAPDTFVGRTLTAGAGVSVSNGDGVSGNPTVSLPNVGTQNTYGDAATIPVITTDAQGRVSSVTNTSVNITSTQVSDFTEAAQDAVGVSLTDTATIDFTYNDSLNTITADVKSNSITNTQLAQMPANTIKGNNTGSTANSLDLTSTQVTAMLNNMVSDSVTSAGTKGLVPFPPAGTTENGNFLTGSGWVHVSQQKPRTPPFSSFASIAQPAGTDKLQSVLVNGNYAYVSCGTTAPSVVIYNVADPLNPVQKGTINGTGDRVTSIQGNYLYMGGTGSSNIYIADITDPNNPTITATLGITGGAGSIYNVVASGNYLYCSTQSKGLTVVDITSKTSPVQVYQEGGTLNKSVGVALSQTVNNRLFTTNYQTTSPWTVRYLKTWDITTPTAPTLLNTYTLPAGTKPSEIQVYGNYAYIYDSNTSSIQIIDVTNPSSPNYLSSMQASNQINTGYNVSVTADSNYAYVSSGSNATYGGSIDYFDISNKSSPVLIATYKQGVANSVWGGHSLSNGYLYVANYGVAPGNAGSLEIITTANDTSVVGNATINQLTVKSGLTIGSNTITTVGNITDSGTDGITITNGTNAVINSGVTISQHVADGTHNGYLSATDWSTFNSKQPAGNYLSDLTGDVSASGPGSAAATVNTVGGSSATNIHSAELLANAATNLNTASTIVKRDSSGNILITSVNGVTPESHASRHLPSGADPLATGTPVQIGTSNFLGSADSFALSDHVHNHGNQTNENHHALVVAGTSHGFMSKTDKTKLDAATNLNTASTIVMRDSSGNFSAGTITASLTGNVTGNVSGSSATFTGALVGDVTGTQGATVVSQVDGKTATQVSQSVTDTENATNLNTVSTIVKRDSSGNFSAGTITANLTGAASANLLKAGDTMTGYFRSATVALTDAATIAIDASLGNTFTVTLGGNRTLGTPTNPLAGQKITLKVTQDGTGNRTLSYNSSWNVGIDFAGITLSSTAGATDYIGAIYNSNTSKWDIIAIVRGY